MEVLPEDIIIQAPEFDAVAVFGIGGLAVLMAALCIVIYSRGNRRRALLMFVATAIGMSLSVIAAKSGLLSRFDIVPPPMLVMMVSVFVVSFVIGFSSLGRELAMDLPLATLVGLQGFRFPLELVMHHAGERSIMPIQLSFSGYNFDILTGIGAILLLGLFWSRFPVPRWAVWIWNIWGGWCLLVIAAVAVMASPVVRAFGSEPHNLNTWVLFFPYVWLPVVLVTIALSGHIIITRKLLRNEQLNGG